MFIIKTFVYNIKKNTFLNSDFNFEMVSYLQKLVYYEH